MHLFGGQFKLLTVIARARGSSKYSTLSMVHREEGIDRPLGLCTHASLTLYLIQKNALNKTADLG
jgi:hypothetical protein